MFTRRNLAGGFILFFCSAMVVDAAAQTVILSPRSLEFVGTVGGPNPSPQTVAITNGGTGTLSWRIAGSIPPWLSVSPQSGGGPGKMSFAVNIAGLGAGTYRGTVSLALNDSVSPTEGVKVSLVVRAAPSNPQPVAGAIPQSQSEYEVELRFTGYTGLVEGYPNCQVNTQGTDVLKGRVAGIETSERDEDVVYSGILERTTAIDFCETKGKDGPDDDERVWCVATLTGSASMKVEITVYGEADRGAWIKADPDPSVGTVTKRVSGNCDAAEMTAARDGYPGGDGGASPNGQPILDALSTVKFFDGNNQARLRVGHYPPDPKLAPWALTVLRKIR